MLRRMRGDEAGSGRRPSLAGTANAATMQRDNQTLTRSPSQQRDREQQRRQQIKSAFDQDVRHNHDAGSYRQTAPARALDAARRPGEPW
jgi:hypothetical protein